MRSRTPTYSSVGRPFLKTNPVLILKIQTADETTELGPTFIFPDEGLDQEYTTLSDTTPFFPDDSVTSLSPGNVVWDQTPGQDSAFLSPDYGLLSDQTTALDPILFYDDVLNEDQLDEPDWALSLDEDMDWLSRTAETDAIFLFADADIDCEIHDDGRVQRLHKTRRGASCSSPTMEQSEKEKPKRPDEDSFDFKAFIEHQPPSEIFSDNTELCSEEKFKKSIIPVLKNDAIPGSLVWNYPNPWFSLLDVLPRKLSYIEDFVDTIPAHLLINSVK